MGAAKGSPPWNAGTSKGWTDKRGYRWLYVTDGGCRRARREHRVVMEQHLGRRLEPWELVHHRDENPSNNSIDNLELRQFGEHTAEHHRGTRKSADAKRSMEAFALLREELKHERALRADLLAALNHLAELFADLRPLGDDTEREVALLNAHAAIAKATAQ